MGDSLPLILLSGMAADARLFAPQRAAFPGLLVPDWISPLTKEPLPAYAARLARRVDPGGPCLVGGASFGGLVALEMAPHLQTRACLMIGSVRSPSELPWWYRLFRPAAALGPKRLGWCAGLAAGARPRRLSEPGAVFLRWASWAALSWQPSRGARQTWVLQIHGDADRTLPIRYTRPDWVVAGGGHLLPLTHPQAVNDFLRHAGA
jgi:pimeloyl-ACP methyl ester carboxylesterase